KPDRLFFFLAVADDKHLDILAHWRICDDLGEIAHFPDVLSIESDDDITRLDACGLGRSLFVYAGHQRAACRFDAEAFGDFIAHLLDAYAQPPAAHLLELAQLIDHRHDRLRRHRKTDADRATGRRNDRRVYSDHLAVEIEQRPARIPAIDGGVRLDVVVIRPRLDTAIARGHDAGGYRPAKTERISDSD